MLAVMVIVDSRTVIKNVGVAEKLTDSSLATNVAVPPPPAVAKVQMVGLAFVQVMNWPLPVGGAGGRSSS